MLKTTQDAWGLSLLEHLPTGTDLRLDSTNVLTDSTVGNAVAPKVFHSELTLSLIQREMKFTALEIAEAVDIDEAADLDAAMKLIRRN